MDDCSICKEQPKHPHILPCNHFHCFLCITRHLQKRNFCPTCHHHPLHVTDLQSLEEEYKNILPNIKTFILNNKNEEKITKELKKYNLRYDGSLTRKRWRLNEFLLLYAVEKQKKLPKSKTGILRSVHQNEQIIYGYKENPNIEIIKKHFKQLKLIIKK